MLIMLWFYAFHAAYAAIMVSFYLRVSNAEWL